MGGGLAFSACGASATPARRTVETPLGRLDIPVAPRRVLAVDSRISLESALALELPVVGYSHSRARPWVPVPAGVPMLAAPPDLEQILMLKPDLILCPDTAPYSDWWPLARLAAIAPVLPSNHRLGWQVNLARLAGWLALTALAEPRLAAHEELVASIRRRHGAAIASMRVAALYFDPLKRRAMVCSDGTAYGRVMPAQVLAELGGREVDAGRLGPSGDVALEAFGDVFGDVDALLVLDFGDGSVGALAGEALWQRLPAVRAGHVHIVAGNCTFGSFYTAQYLADAWAALYARAEA
ncbi:ABC transporter substrate-binding protein [Ancylobacter oerskovii]|uniref:ABC transporter substrate-binding protein n=1 Tax=Ancylobacter oerskovii TaxID=459519 RepID=UPI001BCADF3A|nr:ABC transporter substrate-binding protein [Ancylobacter oerskovii]